METHKDKKYFLKFEIKMGKKKTKNKIMKHSCRELSL